MLSLVKWPAKGDKKRTRKAFYILGIVLATLCINCPSTRGMARQETGHVRLDFRFLLRKLPGAVWFELPPFVLYTLNT